MCAHAVAKLDKEGSVRAQWKARVRSKWASFTVRPATLQASHLAQHAAFQAHKLAVDLYLSPDAPVHEVLKDASAIAEHDLFKGSVPQPADWLRAWRSLVEGTSFRETCRRNNIERFIDGLESVGPSRHAIMSLQRIIVECVREETQRRQAGMLHSARG